MGRGQVDLSWQVLEEDEWDEKQHALWARPSPPTGWPHWRAWVWRGLATQALAASIAGYGVWRTGQAGLSAVQAEIQHTAERENQAWQEGDLVQAMALADGPRTWADWGRMQWAAEVVMGIQPRPDAAEVRTQRMELHGDLALVEVIELRQAVPYREARVYRQVGNEWLRAAPVPELWGPQCSAETEHFRFVYRQRDAAAVAEVMAGVEELYAGIRREMGLGSPEPDRAIMPSPKLARLRSATEFFPAVCVQWMLEGFPFVPTDTGLQQDGCQ